MSLAYRESHREELREQARIYYAAHKAKCAENSKAYRLNHRLPGTGLLVCKSCRKEVVRNSSRQAFCSRPCKRRAGYAKFRSLLSKRIEAGTASSFIYNGYGKDWPLISADILLRDNFTCRCCKEIKRLRVHHIYEFGEGGTHDPSNLVTLCLKCHMRGHKTNLFFWTDNEQESPALLPSDSPSPTLEEGRGISLHSDGQILIQGSEGDAWPGLYVPSSSDHSSPYPSPL